MKRFTVVNEGYNMEEVNRFIDIVINQKSSLCVPVLIRLRISSPSLL